ncbi:MAG: sigma-54-dependent transcriptional regulator [Spirochaetia bacterium]
MSTFLILDPDPIICADICSFFHNIGHSMYRASDFGSALSQLEKRPYDVIISSTSVVGGTIHDLIHAVKPKCPDAAIIVIADIQTVQEAVLAVSEGAFGILQKPFSIPELNFQIRRALERRSLKTAPAEPERIRQDVYQPYNFIGESLQIKRVFKIVNRVARTDSSVIIVGETGTGKELVAGAIHYNSQRAAGPFVRVNCAALPEQLLESELFGYEKGAFTGADHMRVGRFEHANGGTIFLDEVADMSLMTQAKVLRVIQEKEFERVGSNQTLKTDVRIISATNKDLMERMRQGLFREDLFYRLNVVTVRLPPLREREGDIALLLQFFLKKFATEMNKKIQGVEPRAMEKFTRYPWPGNIRELENAIERAVLLAEGEVITGEDLDLFFDGAAARFPRTGLKLADAERDLIQEALQRSSWVQKDAAGLLGISTRVLNYKVRQLGFTHPGWKHNK